MNYFKNNNINILFIHIPKKNENNKYLLSIINNNKCLFGMIYIVILIIYH